MNNLESLVLSNIFDYFNVNEKIKLTLVCKAWHEEIGMILNNDQDSLFIYLDYFPINSIWSNKNQLIKYRNSLNVSNIKNMDKVLEIFKNIKNLYIFKYFKKNEFEFLFKKLSNFKLLEQLEIYKCRIEFIGSKLDLPNLKNLIIKKTFINDQLELETPLLETFIFWSKVKLIKFNYLSKLKRLETLEYKLCRNQFKNLESIKCQDLCCGDLNNDHQILIKSLLNGETSLKEIHFNETNQRDLFYEELKRNKERLEKNGIKLLISSLDNSMFCCWKGYQYPYKVYNCNQVDNYASKVRNDYPNIPYNLSWLIKCHYTYLTDSFTKRLPVNFFSKFTNIHTLRIKKLDDQTRLIEFMSGCKRLKRLELDCNELTEDFYGKLHFLNSIRHLMFGERTRLDFENYEWLNYLVNLSEIAVHSYYNPPVDLIKNAFDKCKHLKEFNYLNQNFSKRDIVFMIYRNNNHFGLKIASILKEVKEEFKELTLNKSISLLISKLDI